MAGEPNSNEPITIITGHDFAKHPFYKERSELDEVSGHDWLMILSLGLTCAMGFRLGAIALQLLNYPTWMMMFIVVLMLTLMGLTYRLKFKMPKMLSAVCFGSALGFAVGFFL